MKIFKGKVVSIKMLKTATVSIEKVVVHPVYAKRFRKTKKYHVHDEFGTKVGDVVKFVACRPYSKNKRWKIVELIKSDKPEIRKPKPQTKPNKTKLKVKASTKPKKGGK